MYGNSGMFPSYGYNQVSPLQQILQGISTAVGGVQTGYNSPGGYLQPTFGDTYNQGMFSGTNGVILIGLGVLVLVLLLK